PLPPPSRLPEMPAASANTKALAAGPPVKFEIDVKTTRPALLALARVPALVPLMRQRLFAEGPTSVSLPAPFTDTVVPGVLWTMITSVPLPVFRTTLARFWYVTEIAPATATVLLVSV